MSGKKFLGTFLSILFLIIAAFMYLCYRFKPDDPQIGILSAETFDSIQDYFDRDPFYDSIQRKIGLKPPRGMSFYFNTLDEFGSSGDAANLPDFYYQVDGLNEIIEPKGLEGRIEWRMAERQYLNYTLYFFWGGIGENRETAQLRKKFYGSSDRLLDTFQDKELEELYQNGDIFLQFVLSIPNKVKRGEYVVSLLDMNFDPFRFSNKSPALISYKVARKNNVDTYTIRVKRGALVYEKTFSKVKNIPGDASLYRLALRQNGKVEIWTVDPIVRSLNGDFFDVFQPVGVSDKEYVEPTSDKLREAKESRFAVPGGIGFYGQSYELEASDDRVYFSYMHLSNSMSEVDIVQKEFERNKDFYLIAIPDHVKNFKEDEKDEEDDEGDDEEDTTKENDVYTGADL